MAQSADLVIIALRKRLSGYLRLSFVATITENYNYEAFLELRFKTGTKVHLPLPAALRFSYSVAMVSISGHEIEANGFVLIFTIKVHDL